MWSVPLGNVLKAHGYEALVPFAYACSGVSAFISPMIFGALADQRISPTRLVRWLAVATAEGNSHGSSCRLEIHLWQRHTFRRVHPQS